MRLVLVDDHPLVIQGIVAIVQCQDDMEVVGTANTGDQALRVLQESQPDIAVVDLRLSGTNGLDVVKQGRSIAPGCRFIILTSSDEKNDVRSAITEKIEGYVLKEAMPEEILSAIRLVGKGRSYIDPAVMQTLVASEKEEPMGQLTPREMEVLEALAHGMSNKEIAELLFVTEYTVKKHVSQILDKLGVADRTQAALYAVSKGLGAKNRSYVHQLTAVPDG